MLDYCIGNKQRKLTVLHQLGQQKGVFASERTTIKKAGIDICFCAPYGESGSVQVSNATAGLNHVSLKAREPQLFCSADQGRAISGEPKLKTIVLRGVGYR
jgi:hypothetical protein